MPTLSSLRIAKGILDGTIRGTPAKVRRAADWLRRAVLQGDHLLDHPALYAPVCRLGALVVSRFHNGPDVPDIAVPIDLLIEGVDMDIRDHGHCVSRLIAALPADKTNIEIRLDAHTLCVTSDDNHRRTRAACDKLIPGMTDPALEP